MTLTNKQDDGMPTLGKLDQITVYACKLPSGGVAIYRRKDATNQFCQFASHASNKPTRRNKWVTLNCFKWRLEWI